VHQGLVDFVPKASSDTCSSPAPLTSFSFTAYFFPAFAGSFDAAAPALSGVTVLRFARRAA